MKTKIKLYKGDITDLEVDAIVNAANNYMYMGSGVAGAIKRKGGKQIEDEAVAKGPIPIGEALVTGAGKLKAKYVIHAAAMGRDLITDSDKIRDATKNSLKRADEIGLKTIALPALGTGAGRFPLNEAARVMIDVIRDHIKTRITLSEIILALFDQKAYDIFKDELER